MERLILDTGVLIAIERRKVSLDQALADDDDPAIAAITAAELLQGVELADDTNPVARQSFVDTVLATIPVEEYTVDVARAHARLLAPARRAGQPRGAHDQTGVTSQRVGRLGARGSSSRPPGCRRLGTGLRGGGHPRAPARLHRGPAREEMETAYERIAVAAKNTDTREHDIADSDDCFQYHGGRVATVRVLRGTAPEVYIGDSTRPETVRTRTLVEETSRVFRARVVNPKWIEAMCRPRVPPAGQPLGAARRRRTPPGGGGARDVGEAGPGGSGGAGELAAMPTKRSQSQPTLGR